MPQSGGGPLVPVPQPFMGVEHNRLDAWFQQADCKCSRKIAGKCPCNRNCNAYVHQPVAAGLCQSSHLGLRRRSLCPAFQMVVAHSVGQPALPMSLRKNPDKDPD